MRKSIELGGDEFVAVFPGCGDPRIVAHTVDAMLGRLAERFEINDQALFIGASAGIAIGPADGANVEVSSPTSTLHFMKRRPKAAAPTAFSCQSCALGPKPGGNSNSELRRAFAENEFELFFQPQMRLRDGALVGAEALVRWRHPERGILAPGAFIEALAESPVGRDVRRLDSANRLPEFCGLAQSRSSAHSRFPAFEIHAFHSTSWFRA